MRSIRKPNDPLLERGRQAADVIAVGNGFHVPGSSRVGVAGRRWLLRETDASMEARKAQYHQQQRMDTHACWPSCRESIR
jgi:hypothetical protein